MYLGGKISSLCVGGTRGRVGVQQSGQKGLEKKIPLSFTYIHVGLQCMCIKFWIILWFVYMCFKSEYQIFYLLMSLTSLMVVGTGRHGRGVLTQ